MATDKHFNEEGVLPEPLEDQKGTDMPATKGMFKVIIIVAIISVIGLLIINWFS